MSAAGLLFERNLAALERHAPALVVRLRAITAPKSAIVGSGDGGDLNLDLGHTTLYSPDAQSFADSQLANYRLRPTRMFINLPQCPATPELIPHYVLRAVFDRFTDRSVPAFPTDPHEHAGFMIVYGIGLGLHLETLVRDYDCRHLVLIEEFPEFLYQSLHLVDWTGWLDRITERGGTVKFMIGSDPAQMAHWL
jgi:Glycosyltransferase Maf N-terminal domain